MGEGQVIQGIIGGILAIVGILLAIISSGIWFRRVKIRIGFLGIGLALSGVGLFILITSLPQYAIGFSVLATLALASAAFLTIKEANAREERHRQEELAKERRDKDERLLNEIIEWAEDVARLNFKIFNFIEAQISKESWIESGIGEIVSQFQVVETKGVYMNSIAISSFKEDKKLSKAVKAVNKEIRGLADVSVKRLDKEVTSEIVTEHVNLLRVKITALLKETAKIKSRDIG